MIDKDSLQEVHTNVTNIVNRLAEQMQNKARLDSLYTTKPEFRTDSAMISLAQEVKFLAELLADGLDSDNST